MVNFWYIKGDFLKERSRRIGASDIPALIPNPEKPTESLAAYGRTPITVWQEKTGRKERDPAGLAAEMGNYLEPKTVELFIRKFSGSESARRHTHERASYEFRNAAFTDDARVFQHGAYVHHTQFYRDGMICHPDAIYDPSDIMPMGHAMTNEKGEVVEKYNPAKVTHDGVTVDLTKPFLVEAKTAGYWSAKRPEGSVVKGYDIKLKTWHGIPLKHYMQIQFQLALLDIDVAYLPLIHDTSEFDIWQIRANKKHQGRLIDLAGKMVYHIEHDTPPGDMAMNAADIMALYPDVGDDFAILNGEERDAAIEIAKKVQQAKKQQKRWKEEETDALDAMAVLLKDRPEIRDGEGIIARWQKTTGSEKITKLSQIKDENPLAYRYLERKELLYTNKDSRRVVVPWKGDDLPERSKEKKKEKILVEGHRPFEEKE